MTIVYKATNTVNGQFYIGVTSRSLEERKKSHCLKQSKCWKFKNAINKYGINAFKWEIIKEFLSTQDALDYEIKLIAELKPRYNIACGGRGNIGIPRTKKWRDNFAKSPRTKDWKNNISKALKGRTIGNGLQIALVLIRNGINNKKVFCTENNRIFESVKEAAEWAGCSKSLMSEVCAGKYKTAKGRHFSFYREAA